MTVRQVTPGASEGDATEITSGVNAGDELVTVGVDRLLEGGKVNPQVPGESPAGGEQESLAEKRERGSRERKIVNPSRTFILRPVATSLLMVGILLVGAVAYKQLPGIGTSGSRLSDHSSDHVLSWREPGRDGIVGDRAAGTADWGRCPGCSR